MRAHTGVREPSIRFSNRERAFSDWQQLQSSLERLTTSAATNRPGEHHLDSHVSYVSAHLSGFNAGRRRRHGLCTSVGPQSITTEAGRAKIRCVRFAAVCRNPMKAAFQHLRRSEGTFGRRPESMTRQEQAASVVLKQQQALRVPSL
jgi:hypothetical protein